jgi:hypothetical protein
MLHIENLTVNVSAAPSPMFTAFLRAVMSGPEVNPGAEGEVPVPTAPAGQAPRIGEYWAGQGGIYAGIARGRDGEPDYHLILCKEAPENELAWQAALDHAKTIEADGHKDFTVPTRWESALLYANLQDQFDVNYWHWTSTQYSENLAWLQGFGNGTQSLNL